MNKVVSRALWGAFFVGGLTVLGAGAAHAADTSGEEGTASGNQVGILSELPVTIGGNAISILGESESSGTSTVTAADASSTGGSSATTGEDGIASGNQVMPDIVAPIVATGNAISILGDSSTEGTSTGVMPNEGTDGTEAGTTGEDGIASGNQVFPDVDAPVTVTGNDVSVIRDDVLDDGLLNDGPLDDGLFGDGLLNDGLFDGEILDGPLVRIGIIDGLLSDLVVGDSMVRAPLRGELISEPVVTSRVVDGALFGDVDLEVLAPLAVDGTDGTPGADGTDGVMAPLMVTAAVTPAMMLAATGTEALPLIGGIVLMLGTGLGLVASKRLAQVNG